MYEFTWEKVRGLMAEKGLKQIDIADALNISYQSANAKINGKVDFTLKEIKELARLLNVEFLISKGE